VDIAQGSQHSDSVRPDILAKSPQSLALRGKVVQVHELDDGTVKVWDGAVELPAREFRKEGGVRPQDVADNKFLASTLERVRKAQIAEDLRRLRDAKMTNRQQARRRTSLVERAAPNDAAALAAGRLPAVPTTEPSNEKTRGTARRS
jgi:hypothetical protein